MIGRGGSFVLLRLRSCRLGEQGAAAALVVLFLPCLLASVGLAVDVGVLLVARAELQAAADMGALAGVQELDYDLLAQGRIVIQAGQAAMSARQWVLANTQGQAFIEPGTVRTVVTVLNLEGPGGNAVCPVTGRPVAWPTVCIQAGALVRLPFLPLLGPVEMSVHADASIVGRP